MKIVILTPTLEKFTKEMLDASELVRIGFDKEGLTL